MRRDRGAVGAGDLVRFCNNPACERCDEHLRPWEVLRKAAREVCPACHEGLIVRQARPRPPLIAGKSRPRPA
ncbi:MAG: hypothetical protein HY002_20170 [Candidatus Rokubacteria bacterium]|nr:hypothetical protein [Candidatus Rokubacteria bacterium]